MIDKIYIQNFRSIKELTLDPKQLCGLIGPNGSGKTNVLEAIEIMLGETYPGDRAFNKNDFYNRETEETITIRLYFSEGLGTCWLKPVEPRGASAENCAPTSLQLTHTRKEGESMQTKFTAFDLSGREFWANAKAREKYCFVYIPSDRNLEKQMTMSQWTLLGKILKKVDENFRKKKPGETMSQLEVDFRNAMEEPKRILESDFDPSLDYKKFKETFIGVCKEFTKGLANDFSLSLEIYDPLFYYKTIQVIGKEEMGEFNIQELGSGVQNLILISLFRTYGKLMKDCAILAIEEPEIFLYPHAQRQLYKSFIDLAYPEDSNAEGTQIFYTTHNPTFVSPSRAHELEVLKKTKEGGTQRLNKSGILTPAFLEEKQFETYTNFNSDRNELFFATKIIFVEGYSDKILLTKLCERWGINLDALGVSIIQCGGKTGVIYFIGVCRLLGFENFFALWDSDDDGSIVDEHELLSGALEGGNGLSLPGNLEKFLTTKFPAHQFRDGHKVEDAHKWASEVDLTQVPEEFEAIRRFLTPPEITHEEVKEDPVDPLPDIQSLYPSDIKAEDLPF